MLRTKIVATIGPACDRPEGLRALLAAGVDVARINMAHGTHEEHARVIAGLRGIARDLARPVAVLVDLAGPKIRIGALPRGTFS